MTRRPSQGPLRRWREDRRGTVSIIMASSFTMLMAAGALAVDLGSIFLQSRKLQGMADLAAISAASDITHAQAAAQATAQANGWNGPLKVDAVSGAYSPDPATPVKERFRAGAASPNAVRVTLNAQADLFFGQVLLGKPTTPIARTATAARADLASFSIGTRLASLQGGVANQLLTALTGSSVSLSVMDYNALAGAKVDLFKYTEALATSADLTGVSYDKVLAGDISTGKALTVLSDVLAASGDLSASVSVKKLAQASGTSATVQLDNLIDLGPYGRQDHISGASKAKVQVGVMDLANALLMLADQNRQVKLDLGANVPGVVDTEVWLAIGERPNNSPWLAIDRDGEVVVRTAQTRLYVKAQALSLLGLLGAKPVTLPVFLEVASGEAKLSAMSCPEAASAQSATLLVRPGVGRLVIGEVDTSKLNNFKQPMTVTSANIIDLLAVKATGKADVSIGGLTWKSASFTQSDIQAGVIKTVATDDIAKATVTSLLQNLDLKVEVLGLGLSLGPITSSLSGTLGALAGPVDSLLNGLTSLLGVKLGEADVRVNGLRCRDAALVA